MRALAPGPIRTCVGCRARAPKADLLRVAAGREAVSVDPQARAGGRGAYVHRDAACLEAAGRPGVLGKALRGRLGSDEVGRLMNEIERMGVA